MLNVDLCAVAFVAAVPEDCAIRKFLPKWIEIDGVLQMTFLIPRLSNAVREKRCEFFDVLNRQIWRVKFEFFHENFWVTWQENLAFVGA